MNSHKLWNRLPKPEENQLSKLAEVGQYDPQDYLLQNFIQKYDLYYSKDIPSSYVSATDYQIFQNKEFYELYYTKDFNPGLSDSLVDYYKQWPIAGYYQEYTAYTISNNPLQIDPEYETKENETTVNIDLDGEIIPGTYFELAYNYYDYSYRAHYVEFEKDELWYSINQWDLNYTPVQLVKQNPVRLSKMTAQEAQDIDQRLAPSAQYPEIILDEDPL